MIVCVGNQLILREVIEASDSWSREVLIIIPIRLGVNTANPVGNGDLSCSCLLYSYFRATFHICMRFSSFHNFLDLSAADRNMQFILSAALRM